MKWRVPGQEVGERKLGERCGKRLSARKLNNEHAMDRRGLRKQIRDD